MAYDDRCEINRSKDGKSYVLKIDGVFAGNFDTVTEAAKEYEDQISKKEEPT